MVTCTLSLPVYYVEYFVIVLVAYMAEIQAPTEAKGGILKTWHVLK